MQNEILTTVFLLAALMLFAWIAWHKSRSGQRASWLQQEEARLKERYLETRSSLNRER